MRHARPRSGRCELLRSAVRRSRGDWEKGSTVCTRRERAILHDVRGARHHISARLLTVAVALTLALAGCTGDAGSAVAATVGETVITIADVDAAYSRRAETAEVASGPQTSEAGPVDEDLRREVLTNLIRREILRLAAEDQGIEVTEEDLTDERAALVERLGGQQALDELLAVNGVSEDQLRAELRDQAIQTKLGEALSEDVSQSDVRAAFEEDPQNRYGPMIAVRHILTETRGEAQDAVARLNDGEAFAAVARDVSTDSASAQNGGDLGEIARGQTVPAFEEAAFGADVGAIVGPVQTDVGFHVIQVTDRTPAPTFSEVEEGVRAQLQAAAGGRAFSDYIIGFVDVLSVEVDRQYGRWDSGSLSVVSTARPDFPARPPGPTAPSASPTG